MPPAGPDGVQASWDDEESEAATERELAWMWLADLDARVGELEALLGIEPGQMGIDARVAELELLAEFLPALYELAARARAERQHRPLWERSELDAQG